jgi:phosphoesterase RecJ-like protein
MKNVLEAIRAGQSFLVATHLNPDGDALGSAIALGMALESAGKKVHVYDRDGVPDTYSFLPGAGMVMTSVEGLKADTIILVDCNNLTRAGLEDFEDFRTSVVIDHHETDADFGDIQWISPDIPATGMMVLEVIRALGLELTKDMAQNIYAAISLDTGTFRYSNTTAEALRAGAELTEAGAEPGYVADRLYSNWSANRFALFRRVMEALEMEEDTCFMRISLKMLAETSTTQSDTENFVNFPLLMDNIRASVLLKEVESGRWKISMRSKGLINVAHIAEMFKGGGHRNAAGCTLEGQYDEIKALLIKELKALEPSS